MKIIIVEIKNANYGQIIARLHQGSIDGELLRSIGEILDRGHGQNLITAIIEYERANTGSDDGAIESTMALLQSLASINYLIGCCLMVHLWPIAGNLRMHQECDSIELWICDPDNRSLHLADYIETLVLTQHSAEGLRYREWINEIRCNA